MSRWLVVIASVRNASAWVTTARASVDIVDFADAVHRASRDLPADVPFAGSVVDGWSSPLQSIEDEFHFEIPPWGPPDAEGFRQGVPVAVMTIPSASATSVVTALSKTLAEDAPLDGYALRSVIALLEAAGPTSAMMRGGATIVALGMLGRTLDDYELE